MEKINVRSPYYIRQTVVSKDYLKCELWIYTGTSVTDRGAVKYTLTNRTPNDGFSVFEISELIRDYLVVEFDGTYTSQMVWTDYRFTTGTDSGGDDAAGSIFVGESYDGFGYFHEGRQSTLFTLNEQDLLQSNTVVYKPKNNSIRIPVSLNGAYDVYFSYKGNPIYSYPIGNQLTSSTRIGYLSDYWGVDVDSYKERVQLSSGTYESSSCLDDFLGMFDLTPIDRVVLANASGVETVIDVKSIGECRYTPIKATFVNKFGVLQDLWFFKNYSTSISTKGTEYKANLVNTGSYTPTKHQEASLGINGSEKITLNSGYYPEEYNEIFKQLFLSEKIWLEIDGITFPALISGKNVKFKTQLTDKLIEYAINFEFSNEIINNIR